MDESHRVTVPLSEGLFRAVRGLARQGSVGAYLAAVTAKHVRTVDIGRKYVPDVPAAMFVDEGGGP